jgi:hypothetical protein
MAFLQLEDPQGTIEVVTFPRTFNDCRDVIHEDALVLVRGKVQVREEKLAVLADLVWNYPLETPKPEAVAQADRPIPGIFSNTPVIVPPLTPSAHDFVERVTDAWLPPAGDWDDEPVASDAAPPAEPEPLPAPPVPAPTASLEIRAVSVIASPTDAPASGEPDDWVMPADDAFADEISLPAAPAQAESAALETPLTDVPMTDTPKPDSPFVPSRPPALPEIKLTGGVPVPSKNSGNGPAQPRHTPPAPHGNGPREGGVTYLSQRSGASRRVRVRLRRTNDNALDTRRMREIVKLLRSAEGRDRFALIVPSQKSWVELDFPNFYTNIDQIMGTLLDRVSDWAEVELG